MTFNRTKKSAYFIAIFLFYFSIGNYRKLFPPTKYQSLIHRRLRRLGSIKFTALGLNAASEPSATLGVVNMIRCVSLIVHQIPAADNL